MRAGGRISFAVGAALVLVAWVVGWSGLGSDQSLVVGVLAEVLAGLGVILAWRFQRSRLALAVVIVAIANWLLRGPLSTPSGDPAFDLQLAALALLLPLNLAVVALLREGPLQRPSVVAHTAVLFAEPWLVAVALERAVDSSRALRAIGPWLELARAPEAWLMAHLVAVVVVGLAFAVRKGTLEGGLIWVLVVSSLIMVGDLAATRAALLMVAAQLALLLGFVEESYRLAFHDELTGLPGRRAFNDAIRRLDGTFALAMVDVDHFKRFNDHYGHDAGDQVLRMVADELGAVRGGGRAFRYGGEEFAVVFAGRTAADALQHLESLREAIAGRSFAIRSPKRPRKKPKQPRPSAAGTRSVHVTVSIGVAGPAARRPSPDEVLRAADRALYRAKGGGRNRVVKV